MPDEEAATRITCISHPGYAGSFPMDAVDERLNQSLRLLPCIVEERLFLLNRHLFSGHDGGKPIRRTSGLRRISNFSFTFL